MSNSSNQKRRRHREATDCSNDYQLLRLKNLPDSVNLSKLKTFTGKFVVDKSHAVCKGLWKPNTFKLIRDHSTADNEALWKNNAIAVISFKYEADGKRFYEEVKESRHVYENSRITIDRVVSSYTFNDLPEDVHRSVFGYLNFADKQIAQCVCRRWRNFVQADRRKSITSWDFQKLNNRMINRIFERFNDFEKIRISYEYNSADALLNLVKSWCRRLKDFRVNFNIPYRLLADTIRWTLNSVIHRNRDLQILFVEYCPTNGPMGRLPESETLETFYYSTHYMCSVAVNMELDGASYIHYNDKHDSLHEIMNKYPNLTSLTVKGVILITGLEDGSESWKALENLDISLAICNIETFKFVEKLTSLTSLTLRVVDMTDQHLLSIVRNLPKLEILDVTGNKRITLEPVSSYTESTVAVLICLTCPLTATSTVTVILQNWSHIRLLACNNEGIHPSVVDEAKNIWMERYREVDRKPRLSLILASTLRARASVRASTYIDLYFVRAMEHEEHISDVMDNVSFLKWERRNKFYTAVDKFKQSFKTNSSTEFLLPGVQRAVQRESDPPIFRILTPLASTSHDQQQVLSGALIESAPQTSNVTSETTTRRNVDPLPAVSSLREPGTSTRECARNFAVKENISLVHSSENLEEICREEEEPSDTVSNAVQAPCLVISTESIESENCSGAAISCAFQDVPTVPNIEQDLNAENPKIPVFDAVFVLPSSKSTQQTEVANVSIPMVAQTLSENASTLVRRDEEEELDTLTRRLSLEDSGAPLAQNKPQISRNSTFGQNTVSAVTSATAINPSSSSLSEQQLATINVEREFRGKTKNQKRLERRKRNVDGFKSLGTHLRSEAERLSNQKRPKTKNIKED